ncbi:MAG: M20/M25/M40 family metallo-hydrolase, partial [Planctomycetes bacterium]|nr:M20/M25/M40 family metallo-hydrolase [Planctomycetota bacterium]
MATASTLRDTALNGSQPYALLEELVTIAPKRLAGSAGADDARDWAVRKLEALGFDKVWVQEFQMRGWERVSADARVSSHDDLSLDITSLGRSVSTPDGGITANIAHFATFEDLQAADASEVRGRIIFISNRMERRKDGSGYSPANIARSQGHAEAARKGGLAILIRSIGTDDHDAPHTGTMRFGKTGATVAEEEIAWQAAWSAPYGASTVAAAAVSNADADVLQELLESSEAVVVTLNVKNKNLGEITSYNIIGEITGATRPGEIVITGGHIDAWDTGVGAMDDGMGVAITMHAASLIADLPERPARTIRYVAFGAEEFGLNGAAAYAEEYGNEDHVFGIESDFGIGPVWKLTPAVSAHAIPVLEKIWSVLEPMG